MSAANLLAKILEWLNQNRTIFIDAPIPFLTSIFVGGFIIWLIMNNRLKDSQKRIEELQRRLGESEPDSIHRSSTNKELKGKVKVLSQRLEELFCELEAKEPERGTITIDLLDDIHSENGQPLIKELKTYWEEYRPEVIALRDELFKRLPSETCKPACEYQSLCVNKYDNPISRYSIMDVANDLMRLTAQLKI